MSTQRALPFTQFVAKVLKVKLTDGQRVLCLVAYDGVQPQDLEGAERALARRIFGDVDVIPPEARAVVVAVCGARGGKSYVLCALRLLYLALTVPLKSLAPGEVASALVVAPDLRLARQCLRYALGAAKAVPKIKAMIRSEAIDGFVLGRPDGSVSLEALPATRGGSALRGRSLVGAVLDEAAFFRDEDYSVNDAEVYKAIAPRVMMPFGQTIIASTPWAEGMGLLYELFSENHGKPRTAIAAHAPTMLLRDGDEQLRLMVDGLRERDPDTVAREYDAQFMTAGTGLFFSATAVDAAVDVSAVLPLPHLPSSVTCAGADFAFRSDASALVVARLEGDICRVAEMLEIRPEKGKPLVPSEVVSTFAATLRPYQCAAIYSDRHYEEAMREHLAAHKLQLVPGPDGLSGKVETYTRVRALLHEGKIRLPPEPKLIAQLKAVVSKPTPGGGLTISSPRKGGAHGDIVSAFVLAVASLPTGAPEGRTSAFLIDGEPMFAESKAAA